MCAERSTEGGTSISTVSRKNTRQIQARIFLLDDSVHTFSINSCAIGHELFMAIIDKQNILEADYFDLEYVNSEGVRCWINHNKCIVKQVGAGKDMVFIFAVKFYTSHPNLLEEEYTRYLFALQIKRDIVSGQLICSTNTAALLASYIVQAEIGDFLDEYIDNSYLRHLKLANQPNDEILNKIMEFHKTHIGMSSTEADFHLLDTARKIEYYGVKMHLAKDHENLPLNLSVTHMGVVVFQNLTKINTFSWAKIRKLSFKRKKFLIKLHPEGYGYYKGMVEFYFETRDDCKRFWKKCIEHHAFFRCPASEKSLKKTPKVVTKGSSFRYCGRTQKELIEYVRESYSSKRDSFIRPSKARVSKSPHNTRHARHGKSYHPFAIKSSYSAPSRAVSDGSDLDRTDLMNQVPHTPCKQKSINNTNNKTRWSQSARQSPRDDLNDTKENREYREIRDNKDVKGNKDIGRDIPISTRTGSSSQKRARKGRKFIQVSRTGSSDEDDDDKRVTASEMSLSSSGHWDNSANGPVDHLNEEPLPAREAFRGGERLCRQRASIGGFGDVSDSDQPATLQNSDRVRLRPTRQGSEPLSQNSQSPTNRKNSQEPPQRVVCIDQYCTKRPRHPDSLSRSLQPLVSSKRYKSTPNDVAGNTKLQMVDQLDTSELLSDIPYVLLRRHKSNEPPAGSASVKSASQSQRSLASKSFKSVKETPYSERNKETTFGRIRHSKSLDRRLAAMDSNVRPTMAPKSPKLLREEYMQSQRRHVSDRDTIEALKNQLRSASSVRSVSRMMPNGDVSFRNQASGPMFVSAYRLPPVNNFSAKDDTMSPQTLDLDRLYGRAMRTKKRVHNETNENDGDDEVDTEDVKSRHKQKSPGKTSTAFSDSDDSQLHETADLECLLADLLPGNPVYLDSSCSSDDGEFDLSPDRCGRPRSVSESEFKLRTPRSSRRSSLCRGHNSSLSLTDSSFNSGTSFQSEEEGDISGSPYSFLAECGQQQDKVAKNVQESSGDSPQLPDDYVPDFQSRSDTVDLQILEAPKLLDDSPDESDTGPVLESRTPVIDSMSIDRDESGSSNEESDIHCAGTSSECTSSDQVVVVASNTEPDRSVTPENDFTPQPNILVTSPTCTHHSVSKLLESMLLKRLSSSPFVRTSTPTKEYDVVDVRGSTDNIHERKCEISFLKSAVSVPGLVTGRVSPYSPLPTYLRRPFASSSSNSSSQSSSISTKNTNPFLNSPNTKNNPFLNDDDNKEENSSAAPVITQIPNQNNNYEHLFEQTMISDPKEASRKSLTHDSPAVLSSFNLGRDSDLDRALVFLNEGALSSLSAVMTSDKHELADTFQDTVEGNLMCYESSEYTSRPQSLPDEEEPDEYVLPSDHRSFTEETSSSSSPSTSQDSSESGHYQAAPHAELALKEPIQEHSESSTSASEGSEDIEPFPPPPPPSDLLIFDERDEDMFQQLQEHTFNGDENDSQRDINVLPHLDCAHSPTDFPQPPPPLTSTSGYSKEELSSSEVPSLFADDSAATSVAPNDDDQSGMVSPPCNSTGNGNTNDNIISNDNNDNIIINDDNANDNNNDNGNGNGNGNVNTDNDNGNSNVISNGDNLDTNINDDTSTNKDVGPPLVEEIIIPQHASLLYDDCCADSVESAESVESADDITDQQQEHHYHHHHDHHHQSMLMSPIDQSKDECGVLPSVLFEFGADFDYGRVSYEDAFPAGDSSLSSLHVRQLNCRSPDGE